MISKQTTVELRANLKKNDAVRRSNERLAAMLRSDYKLKEDEFASNRKLETMRSDLLPIIAEAYGCTLEEGRQGLKMVGKRSGSARTALSRVLGYFKKPVTVTPFERAKQAINVAIKEGLTEAEAKELLALLK